MKIRILLAAAALGLALSGTGYAACNQAAFEFHPSWPKKSGTDDGSGGTAQTAQNTDKGSRTTIGAQPAEATAGTAAAKPSTAPCN